MKSTFSSRTKLDQNIILYNSTMLSGGKDLYINHIALMNTLSEIDNEDYIPIPDLYEMLSIEGFLSISKRKFYESYKSGVVIGAGSGDDCIKILNDKNFSLIDLQDSRMENFAVGYETKKGKFNALGSSDGDSLARIDNKYKHEVIDIEVKSIDSLKLKKCEVISIDAEGLSLDVIQGSMETIEKFKPDLLVSIYHNWIEYSLIIPLLYDLGYDIVCTKATNFTPSQPQLELILIATHIEGKKQ